MANGDDQQMGQKSYVRVMVTHFMAVTFGSAALVLMIWFLRVGEYDRAEDAFAYVASITSLIVGFWFGSRPRARSAFLPDDSAPTSEGDQAFAAEEPESAPRPGDES